MSFDFENNVKENQELTDFWNIFTIDFYYKSDTYHYYKNSYQPGDILAYNKCIKIILTDINCYNDGKLLPDNTIQVNKVSVNIIFYKLYKTDNINEVMRMFKVLLAQSIPWPTMVESYEIKGEEGKLYNTEYIKYFLMELKLLCNNTKHITITNFNWKNTSNDVVDCLVTNYLQCVNFNNVKGIVSFYSVNLIPHKKQKITVNINGIKNILCDVNDNNPFYHLAD